MHFSAREGRRELLLIGDILKEVMQSCGVERKGNEGEWPTSRLFKTDSRLQRLQSLLLRVSLSPSLLFSCSVLCAALWALCPHFSISSHHSVSSIQQNMSQTVASYKKSALTHCGLDHAVVSQQCRREELYNSAGRPQKRSSFLTAAFSLSPELWLTGASRGAGQELENIDVGLALCHAPRTRAACSAYPGNRRYVCVCIGSHWH